MNWSLEGKETTNGALMKISSLLINVETYTNHTHWERKETHEDRTHTHMPKKQMALLHNLLLLFTLICHFMLSLRQKKKRKEKEKNYDSSSVSMPY